MRRKSFTASDSGRNASDVTEDDGFIPRRSTHVTGPTNADGDTWQESLAGRDNADTAVAAFIFVSMSYPFISRDIVCELAGKLTIRSYFSNERTQERLWDEPPSGASRLVNASDMMRKMAKIQLQEMQIALGTVPDLEQSTPKSKRGLGGFFRRSKVDATSPPAESRIQYRPDSFLTRPKRDHKNSHMYDEQLDPAMQRALVSSMSTRNRSSSHHYDAELERAMTLSLAEAGNANRRTPKERNELSTSSSRLRSSSRDRRRSKSREQAHRDRSERHESHGLTESSAKDGIASPDRSRHRSDPMDGTHRRKSHLQKRHSSHPSEGNKLRVDPPSDIHFYQSVDDGSIVHYEFSHDDQEALAIALSLSMLDVSPPGTTMGVALMPERSGMTEEEQLAKAMEESMAMSPSELKGRSQASATGAFTSDWGDRKMPAGGVAADVSCTDILESLVYQSPPESTTNACAGLHCLESLLPLENDEHSLSAHPTPRRLDTQRNPDHFQISASSSQARSRTRSYQDRPLAPLPFSHLHRQSRDESTKRTVNRSRSPNYRTRITGSPIKNWLPTSPRGNRSPKSPTDNRSPESPTDNRSPRSPGGGESRNRYHFAR